jgi:hypothetical protein
MLKNYYTTLEPSENEEKIDMKSKKEMADE